MYIHVPLCRYSVTKSLHESCTKAQGLYHFGSARQRAERASQVWLHRTGSEEQLEEAKERKCNS